MSVTEHSRFTHFRFGKLDSYSTSLLSWWHNCSEKKEIDGKVIRFYEILRLCLHSTGQLVLPTRKSI